MMSVKVVTVGARGFATAYTRPLLDHINSGKYEYAAVIARNIDACMYADEFRENNIPIYKTLEEFFAENTADLMIISTPPHLHEEQSIYCAEHGANVLCEKPIAPDFAGANAMIEAQERTGKFIAIAYQHSYTTPILNLKKDIASGIFGKPILLKTMVLWPRAWQYYKRGTGWGGRLKDENGKLILDSVASNAAAHFLHNMLFVMGEETDKAAMPAEIEAELLRANDIESFDTGLIKVTTVQGAELYMIASHATTTAVEPMFDFEFENAVIRYRAREQSIVAEFRDGTVKEYGEPLEETVPVKHLWDAIDAVNTGAKLPCDVETALPHNIVINSMYENTPIINFPEELVVKDEENEKTYVKELDTLLKKAYAEGKLLSDLGYEWAGKTKHTVNKKYF